ncbi:MAG: hypothetical protein JW726_04245 [Anaerolineales bacterium]|nr:hypothetical protein [Anaerolineales bacterium]
MGTGLTDIFGLIIGFLLTLMVFSYIIGDNFLFRLAMAIFVGVASGYAAVLVIYNVLWYQLIVPLLTNPMANLELTVPSALLGVWLLAKGSSRLARFGNPVLAYLVGVGAATAVGGAIFGTILPQVDASTNLLNLQYASTNGTSLAGWFLKGLVILVGTLATLAYFHFGVRSQGEGSLPVRHPLVENFLAPAGQAFIAVTFGVLFAGVYAAALGALIDRVRFIWDIILRFL